MNSPNLRTRLQDIMYANDIDGHPLAIEKLKLEFPHTILLIERASHALPRNCYEWALDLNPALTHRVCKFELPGLFADSQFISALLPCLSETSESDAKNDDLAIYFKEQIPTHAGLVTDSRVISKWGSSHIFQHGPLEVPSNYGNRIRFYGKISSHEATMKFIEHVRTHPDYGAIEKLFEDEFGHIYPL